VVTLAVWLGWSSVAIGSAERQTTPNEPDLPPVQLVFQNADGQGIRLAIPQAFLERNSWGESSVALKRVQFPDMLPPPPRRTLQQVTKSLKQSGRPATMENIMEEWAKDYPPRDSEQPLHFFGWIWLHSSIADGIKNLIKHEIPRLQEYDDAAEPGFKHYRRVYNDGTVMEEYLIPFEELAPRSMWIHCYPRERLPNALCSVGTMIGDRLYVTYDVPRPAISSWREIDSKVRTLVHGFIVDCFEGAPLGRGQQPTATYACQF
jgi:hypothetical protein